MSLGFDIDGCQQAIAVGKFTVETAVEWQVQVMFRLAFIHYFNFKNMSRVTD